MYLVTHPATKKAMDQLTAHMPQSLLISGERGSGLATLAREIAGKDIVNSLSPVDKKGSPDELNGTVSVEMIRRLYEQTRSRQTKRQVIVIDDADRMSPAAQGAFLKLLEEPTPHTYFILTSHTPQRLLTTVRSRVQVLTVQRITDEQTDELLRGLKVVDTKKQNQLKFIAAGLPAELTRLVQDEAYFMKRAEVMTDARSLLAGTAYGKILVITKYQADRNAALQLIDSTIAIARRSLSAKAQPLLVDQLGRLLEVRERIAANGNPRLQLTSFVL